MGLGIDEGLLDEPRPFVLGGFDTGVALVAGFVVQEDAFVVLEVIEVEALQFGGVQGSPLASIFSNAASKSRAARLRRMEKSSARIRVECIRIEKRVNSQRPANCSLLIPASRMSARSVPLASSRWFGTVRRRIVCGLRRIM